MMISARELSAKELQQLGYNIKGEDMYVIWFSKTLQNCKIIISTDAVNGYFFEVTYNGDKDEFYVDTYTKVNNRKVEI